MLKGIKRQVLKDQVINLIMERIVNGDLKPGERIIETRIARELGISQSPVREAICMLEHMGAIVTEPYQGSYVRELTTDDFRSMLVVRSEIDALAVRLAVPLITMAHIADLEQIIAEMRQAADNSDLKSLVTADIKLHKYLYKCSGNRLLEKMLEVACYRQWTFFGMHRFTDCRAMHHEVEVHTELVEAIKQRNAGLAEDLMRKHFVLLLTQL